jgi:hypothetical protein
MTPAHAARATATAMNGAFTDGRRRWLITVWRQNSSGGKPAALRCLALISASGA